MSEDYNAEDDFAKSLEEGYRAIRERKAAGGPGWEPKVTDTPSIKRRNGVTDETSSQK